MKQPIIHDQLTQIFLKHYGNEPQQAAENAWKFLEILELYGMQLIRGEWQQVVKLTGWELMVETMDEAAEREPWKAYELNN